MLALGHGGEIVEEFVAYLFAHLFVRELFALFILGGIDGDRVYAHVDGERAGVRFGEEAAVHEEERGHGEREHDAHHDERYPLMPEREGERP